MAEKNPGEKSSIKSIIYYTYCGLVLVFMIRQEVLYAVNI